MWTLRKGVIPVSVSGWMCLPVGVHEPSGFISPSVNGHSDTWRFIVLIRQVTCLVQADLRDAVGSVPDHCTKGDTAIKQVK